ncbi:MAG: S46 family peptidase [Ignavibacteriaceae bacterium]|nr:S46 family peptidase [Ignavibacteriaceae bacterium]
MKFCPILTKLFISLAASLLICQSSLTFAQTNDSVNLDTVKAGRFDMGKMWTFEYPPTDYFSEEYGFTPDKEWYDHVQLATLKFANYCSASFVSADGLIMTNHHCARESVTEIISEGEDFHKDGFIAWDLSEERPVPDLFVEQCIGIEDVTEEIHQALESAESDSERLAIESEKILEIESRYPNDEETFAKVTPLYFGGKYSLYFYKRYNDVRLVFAPESQAGYFGGDYDNFTYPRYNLDCSFFRVYDKDGNPLKVDHYFKWSDSGAEPGEVVFVPGNPASTSRLNTVAQLEYARDYTYPQTIQLVESFIEFLEGIIKEDPDASNYLNDQLLNYYNSKKAYGGMLQGLQDPVLMQKKRVFENDLKEKVQSDAILNNKYVSLWTEIENAIGEMKKLMNEQSALSYNNFDSPEYFMIASQLIQIAEDLKLSEADSSYAYTDDELNESIDTLMPKDFDFDKNNELLKNKIDLLYATFGDDEFLKNLTNGKTGDEAAKDILSRSILTSTEKMKKIVKEGPDAVLNSGDPFIEFIQYSDQKSETISVRMDELATNEASSNQKLGRVLFEVYGTSIPPDATFTLRISDGVIKGFDYNGTIAPPITTFYGLLDRYYSFGGEFPWSLHERWLDAPEEFDFSTPFNFVTTCDVVGGNSGSPIINKDAEVVGVAFDGNIQSLPGDFIYDPEVNRSVGVHSAGMLEAIKDLYQFERLAEELQSGKCCD